VLIEELLEKSVPLLIIDPHGEYLSLRYENRGEEERKQMEQRGKRRYRRLKNGLRMRKMKGEACFHGCCLNKCGRRG
jgi:DNA helicase HerA-like ATPase